MDKTKPTKRQNRPKSEITSIRKSKNLTRNIFSWWTWRNQGSKNGSPQNRKARNNTNDVENHNQTQHPRHQHKTDEERYRPAQHQRQRYPQKQRSKPRRRNLRWKHRRPRPHRRSRKGVVRERNRRRRRTNHIENEGRKLVESPWRVVLQLLPSHHFFSPDRNLITQRLWIYDSQQSQKPRWMDKRREMFICWNPSTGEEISVLTAYVGHNQRRESGFRIWFPFVSQEIFELSLCSAKDGLLLAWVRVRKSEDQKFCL